MIHRGGRAFSKIEVQGSKASFHWNVARRRSNFEHSNLSLGVASTILSFNYQKIYQIIFGIGMICIVVYPTGSDMFPRVRNILYWKKRARQHDPLQRLWWTRPRPLLHTRYTPHYCPSLLSIMRSYWKNCHTASAPSTVGVKDRDNVSAFSHMERQTKNSWLVSKMDMARQVKSRKKPCLGTKDKKTKMNITQKLFVGFLPNLHQQTRRKLVHLFVCEVIVIWIPP